jgi:lysozyme
MKSIALLLRTWRGRVALAAIASAAMLTARPLFSAEEAPRGVRGVDVSRYQGTINWSAVKDDGVHFAFIKATEGGDLTDPTFARNWRNSKRAGVIRGAYHFYRPGTDAARQARHFLRTVKLSEGDLPPVLDVEVHGGIGSTRLQRGVRTWLRIVEEETGKRPIVYTNPGFARRLAGGNFRRHALWIAHYRSAAPRVPTGWGKWTFWQHSERGRVDGIRTRVDINRFRGTLPHLRRFVEAQGRTHH